MVLIKNSYWNYATGELYKSYMNQHQANTTLVCCDKPRSPLKVHGLILAANSEWFELLLKGQYNQEIPLPYKKNIIKHLINLIYNGVVDVEPSIVSDIYKVAYGLKIRGLDFNSVNSQIKTEVKEEPLFKCSPDRSVISPVFDISNTRSSISRVVKNPFAKSKTELLTADNDSDKTTIGSDDEVLVIDNGVSSDIDVVMVDDGSPVAKSQKNEKPEINGTELSSKKNENTETSSAETALKRKRVESRAPTPPSPEVDVEALTPENVCGEQSQTDKTSPQNASNKTKVNASNVEKILKGLLESADRKLDIMLTSDVNNELINSSIKKLTNVCVICCKHYRNLGKHKKEHKFERKCSNKNKCSKCKTYFRTQEMYSLHECKKP